MIVGAKTTEAFRKSGESGSSQVTIARRRWVRYHLVKQVVAARGLQDAEQGAERDRTGCNAVVRRCNRGDQTIENSLPVRFRDESSIQRQRVGCLTTASVINALVIGLAKRSLNSFAALSASPAYFS